MVTTGVIKIKHKLALCSQVKGLKPNGYPFLTPNALTTQLLLSWLFTELNLCIMIISKFLSSIMYDSRS